MVTTKNGAYSGEDIAIVGMAVNVPGAEGVDAYWANLRDGVESIRHLSEQDLLEAGESPENIARKNYVPAAAVLDGYDTFDAESRPRMRPSLIHNTASFLRSRGNPWNRQAIRQNP
jgi:hypothetical protein